MHKLHFLLKIKHIQSLHFFLRNKQTYTHPAQGRPTTIYCTSGQGSGRRNN